MATFVENGPYEGGEMMISVFWWRKPEYPEETTDLRQVTDETFHTYGLCPVQGLPPSLPGGFRFFLWGGGGDWVNLGEALC